VAGVLVGLNPSWNDETVYQEARRIVIAEIQHITYNEYLPRLLDSSYRSRYNLNPQTSGYFLGYDDTVQPMTADGFAASAHRFGHSLVQSKFQRCTNEYADIDNDLELGDEYFNISYIRDVSGGAENLLRGLLEQQSMARDIYFTQQVTDRLYTGENPTSGSDLFAFNIQRGRDNGIAGYNAWREYCGLRPYSSFNDMSAAFGSSTVQKLSSLYTDVDDIDLYVGGLLEDATSNGVLLGETFACIIGQQFHNLKVGDRYWYENPEEPGEFTQAQLTSLRQTSLARLMCDNADSITTIQPQAMLEAANGNWRVPCSDIPSVDLELWLES
jgi:peroxidase